MEPMREVLPEMVATQARISPPRGPVHFWSPQRSGRRSMMRMVSGTLLKMLAPMMTNTVNRMTPPNVCRFMWSDRPSKTRLGMQVFWKPPSQAKRPMNMSTTVQSTRPMASKAYLRLMMESTSMVRMLAPRGMRPRLNFDLTVGGGGMVSRTTTNSMMKNSHPANTNSLHVRSLNGLILFTGSSSSIAEASFTFILCFEPDGVNLGLPSCILSLSSAIWLER